MREFYGDIWGFLDSPTALVGVTTNHFIKKDGTNVMGRGIAKEAAIRFPELPKKLAERIQAQPEKSIHMFPEYGIFTFQVKHSWWEDASLELIEKSCKELKMIMDKSHDVTFVVARPGCGNGRLNWEDVRLILEKYFIDPGNHNELVVGYK